MVTPMQYGRRFLQTTDIKILLSSTLKTEGRFKWQQLDRLENTLKASVKSLNAE